MDIIYTDSAGNEQGYLKYFVKFDITTTGTRDFELQLSIQDYSELGLDYGSRIYIPDTEYGGIIRDIKVDTEAGLVYAMGDTWRGMLAKKIISPPSGQDYKTVSGDANTAIASIVGSTFGALFEVSVVSSGITIGTYTFARYVDMLSGLDAMLELNGAKLRVSYAEGVVTLSAAAAVDYTGDDYSSDKVHFTARDYQRGINHLICLGAGELKAREVVHLYIDASGDIGTTQYYTGADERVATYDYANAESTDDLSNKGRARLQELANYTQMEISVDDLAVEPGDYVSGTDETTGLSTTARVTGVTLTISAGSTSIQYSTEESGANSSGNVTGSSNEKACNIEIGDVLTTINPTHPSERWPGTSWEACSVGRMPAGYDASQTEFDTIKKTGGVKANTLTKNNLPAITWDVVTNDNNYSIGWQAVGAGSGTAAMVRGSLIDRAVIRTGGVSEAVNNLPPYEVFYMWLRTA